MLRLFGLLLFWLAVGAGLGLVVGLFFGMPGGWYWWAGGGVVAAVVVLGLLLWSINGMSNIIAGILAVVALGMALYPQPARADMVSRRGEDTARITNKPCPAEVLAQIEQGNRGYFRAAYITFQGQTFAACWAPMGNAVFLQYADGDRGIIPLAEFKEVPEA